MDMHFVKGAFDHIANVYPRVRLFRRGRGYMVQGTFGEGINVYPRNDRPVATASIRKGTLPKGHFELKMIRKEKGTMVYSLVPVNHASKSTIRVY